MILIIDDEERWMSGYKEALEFAKYSCTVVSSVDELGRWLDSDKDPEKIQLIILDIMMTSRERYKEKDTNDGMDTGRYVLEDIKQLRPNIPVIILTNKDIDLDERVKYNCDYFLLKEETDPDQLVKIVQEIDAEKN